MYYCQYTAIEIANPDHAVMGNIHDGFELKKIREEDLKK